MPSVLVIHIFTLGVNRRCVLAVHVLTTGLGVTGLTGTVHVVSIGITHTEGTSIGGRWIVAQTASCLRAASTRHTAAAPATPYTPVSVDWHNCEIITGDHEAG